MTDATFKTLKIIATEREDREKKTKFMTFKTYGKGGKLIDVKFTKECKDAPNTEGTHTIEVYCDEMNIDTQRRFPVLWIKSIKRVVPLEEVLGKTLAKNRAKLNEFFD